MPHTRRFFIETMTSPSFGELARSGKLVVLLPVGSVEPHGPHMSLATDTVISVGAAKAAAVKLEEAGLKPVIAPGIPYGVTECAAAFPGAISIEASVLTSMVGAVVDAYLAAGAVHVCVINNHLEPAQDAAIQAVKEGREGVSVACPLTRKWGRTLSAEFKSGACHAGQYETSIVLACDPSLVDRSVSEGLPEVPISLAEKLMAGTSDFLEMGLEEAYAGTPAQASAEEGRETLERLAEMIVGEVGDPGK
jgi:creatinine amidohydrolase